MAHLKHKGIVDIVFDLSIKVAMGSRDSLSQSHDLFGHLVIIA